MDLFFMAGAAYQERSRSNIAHSGIDLDVVTHGIPRDVVRNSLNEVAHRADAHGCKARSAPALGNEEIFGLRCVLGNGYKSVLVQPDSRVGALRL